MSHCQRAGALLFATLVALSEVGCGAMTRSRADTPDHGEWVHTLRSLGFVAVFPPREDVQVGDIYAYAANPEGAGPSQSLWSDERAISTHPRWAMVDALDALDAEYRLRPQWPHTASRFIDTQDAAASDPLESAQSRGLFSAAPGTARMPIVALGSWTESNIGGDAAVAMIPSEAAMLLDNLRFEQLFVTASIGAAEAYSLSMEQLAELLLDPAPDEDGARYALKQEFRDYLPLVADPRTGRAFIRVVTDVVYARSADITITNRNPKANETSLITENFKALEAAVGLSEPAEPDDGNPSQPGAHEEIETETASAPDQAPGARAAPSTGPAPKQVAAAAALDPIYAAFVRAQAINRLMREAGSDEEPGSVTRFLSVTDDTVALRTIWQRGVAVGVRGFTLEVDASTGHVLDSTAMGQPFPRRPPAPPAAAVSPEPEP
ncbi:MAG: hypothetical protein ACF8R7_10700 [Phycisphaerales bacterium JB039]